MRVRIYKPSKNAMQSGRAGLSGWVLESCDRSGHNVDSLTGWTSSADTSRQVQLKFNTQEDAVSHAESKGWEYSIEKPRERRVVPKNYTDNFKFVPFEDTKKA